MHNITLLSSFHRVNGNCNPKELYRIIERIQPEVIFEELSPNIFDIVYGHGFVPQSLEAITIKWYLEKYQIQHIPVDTYVCNDADFFNRYDAIAEKSKEYLEFFKQKLAIMAHQGYSFLNSNYGIETTEIMHKMEEDVLPKINNPRLLHLYQLGKKHHDKREDDMLINIPVQQKESV